LTEITLINPDSPFLTDPKVMPPLGLLYIASSLERSGVKVNFVDLAGDSSQKIPKTEYYGVTATTPQFHDAVEVLRKIRSVNPESKVCIGGPHATLKPNECLEAGFDAVVVGEGELAIRDFLKGGRGILAYRIEDIDSIPFPDRSLVKDYDYRIDGERATTIMTSRGSCPYRCAFCCHSWKTKLRFRSPENVRDELKEIKKLGYGAVMLYDDEFFLDPKRDYRICYYLWTLRFKWRCFTRANLVNENMATVASESGCKEVLIGVESGSDAILENINKGTTVKENEEAIKILHGAGIRVKAAMIAMLPGETEDTLKETWEFCERVEPYVSDWDFTICTPYPGSDLYENPEKYDFYFEESAVHSAYKGAGSSDWRPPKVWTSSLSFEDGLRWRDGLERRFKFKK